VSRRKECVFEISGVRREVARRAYQVNSQTQGEISRWLSTLERKTMWEEAQFSVIEYSKTLCQEGIELV
jgi:endonuclease III